MKITDFGIWEAYVPDNLPPYLTGYAFARDEQGRDFATMRDEFSAGKMFVNIDPDGRIRGAGLAPDQYFPFPGLRLLLLSGEDVPERDSDFMGKAIDLESGYLIDPPSPVPQSVTDWQFFSGLALQGEISQQEALAAVRTGDAPAKLQAMVDAMPDTGKRFAAQMLISGATNFYRDNILVDTFAMNYGWTPEQTDDFFRFCATL